MWTAPLMTNDCRLDVNQAHAIVDRTQDTVLDKVQHLRHAEAEAVCAFFDRHKSAVVVGVHDYAVRSAIANEAGCR